MEPNIDTARFPAFALSSADRAKWDPELSMKTAEVPWERKDWSSEARLLTMSVRDLGATPYLENFARRQMGLWVFDSNRMEGVIPKQHREGPTLRMIYDFLDGGTTEPPFVEWDSEGGREPHQSSTERQLFQCAAAAKFLLVRNLKTRLSMELLLETHRIMMEGSYIVEEERMKPTTVGRVRQKEENVHAGDYQFLDAESVESAVEKLVKRYNDMADATSRSCHPVDLATQLFYDLITIHPFENGNERLCRLFLSWSLMRDGFPVAVSFSSGHKKKCSRYMDAIDFARRLNGSRGRLNVMLLVLIDRILGTLRDHSRSQA